MYQRSSTESNRPQNWTAGIDWFRFKVDTLGAVRNVQARIRELQQDDTQRASTLKPWRFNGYEGLASDSIRWGKRGGYLLWESSGQRAASTLGFMGKSGGYALRIDLQTTFRFSCSQPRFGTSLMRYSQAMTPTPLRRQTQLGLSTATSGLWLGTVGRRTSPRFLRIYDKGVESKLSPEGTMWRVELEAKYNHARKLWLDHGISLANPKFCASYVASSAMRLGLRWPYSELVDSQLDTKLGNKQATTAGSLAIWLTHTVRPTIPRLLTVFTVAEVLEMLNLSDVAAPTGREHVRALLSKHAEP